MTRIVAVHTSLALVGPITELFKEHLPGVTLNHLVDDSLIPEVIENNKVTDEVRKRLKEYYNGAVLAGATAIFNICSSVGNVAIEARNSIPIPLLKIDDPMAEEAVEKFDRIGVLATLPTTLEPTAQLVERKAKEKGKKVEIHKGLAEGAFEAVMSGDGDKHDRLILEAAKKLVNDVDVFVLAQGSMARMEKELANATGKVVLSSPALGVLGVKKYLEENHLM